MSVAESFHATQIGVLFSAPATPEGTTVTDPFVRGAGPGRTTCIACGSCMTGCSYGAKTPWTATTYMRPSGLEPRVHPLTTVTGVTPLTGEGYVIDTHRTGGWPRRACDRRRLTAKHVVLAAGTYHTQKLLHRMRDRGALPRLSGRDRAT